MSIKAGDQITIVDLTDAYSIILTSEGYIFPGTTSAAKPGSCKTQVIAMRGAEVIPASVDLAAITLPDTNGITVTKDTNTVSPTLTVTVDGNFNAPGDVTIPVSVADGDITLNKRFSLAIAFTGATGNTGATGATGKGIRSSATEYQAGTSGTVAPTGAWTAAVPTVSAGQFLWTRITTTYTDNTTSTSFSVGMMGAQGPQGNTGATGATGKGVSSTEITYQAAASGTVVPTGTWVAAPPTVNAGQFLWTRTVFTYTDGTTSTMYAVGQMGKTGATGAPGADALSLSVTSSNGTIFKNSAIETVLTAHVYKGGVEITSATELEALGTIKWYKDGGTTAVATGRTLTISAGSVENKAVYNAQLEG